MTRENKLFNDSYVDKVFFLVGLIEQLGTMTNLLCAERQNIEKQKNEIQDRNFAPTIEQSTNNSITVSVSIPLINTTQETALKTSLVFFQFSVLEAIISILSELTIQVNSNGVIKHIVTLSQSEIDFISESSTSYNPKRHQVETRTSYKSIEDRITQVPFLFAKMMGKDFKVSKDDTNWYRFLEMKKLRDNLTHPKPKRIIIEDKSLFDGSTVIYWLAETYFVLVQKLLFENDLTYYKHIENSAVRLVSITYYATSKQFDLKTYIDKHNKLKAK